MSSKGRSRQSGVPLALVGMTNGVGRNVAPAEADRESTWPALRDDVVPPKSSPAPSVRPPAPDISFAEPSVMVAPDPPRPEPAVEAATEAARDDVSVPPIDVDHVDRGFFDADVHLSDAAELEARDPKAVLKRSQAMVVRRAHLAKYVKATMGVALALCVAALVKTALTDTSSGDKAARAESMPQGASTATATVDPTPTTTQAPSPPVAAALPVPVETATAQPAPSATDTAAPAQAAAAESVVPAATAAAPPSEPPAAVDPPKPSETIAAAAPVQPTPAAPPAPSPAPPQMQAAAAITTSPPATAAATPAAIGATAAIAATAIGGASASKEKEHARSALERSSLVESIGAGERSVGLDPSDAEAWLILGAAYQARGDTRNASRCFKACTERSTHGPKGECAAMLH